ncbi:hypothetical protein GF337_05215 [candidate division KSB1 bacterium]|nr:hypothetical protein [candidate division KSB1 bacterium]
MKSNLMLLFSCCLFVIAGVCHSQAIDVDEAAEIALQKNPEIQRAREQLSSARSKSWSAVSPENPSLFLEYEGVPHIRSGLSDYEERKYGISQGIAFPLAYYLRGRIQSSRSEQARAEFFDVRNDVFYRVKRTFNRVLLLQEKQRLDSTMQDLTRELYDKARVKVQAGEAPAYEALKVKVDLAEIENQVLRIDKELENARLAFALLLGEQEADRYQLMGALEYEPIRISIDSLKTRMLENHPQLAAAMAFEKMKRTQRSLAWINELLPGFEVRYFRQEHPGAHMSRAWGCEIGISLPLWFGLKGQAHLRSAAHELYSAEQSALSQKNKLIEELHQAYSRLIVAEKQVLNYRENILKEVEELVRIATRSYEEGEMGYLEVTEALRTLNRTEIGYAETLFGFMRAKAELERVTGY